MTQQATHQRQRNCQPQAAPRSDSTDIGPETCDSGPTLIICRETRIHRRVATAVKPARCETLAVGCVQDIAAAQLTHATSAILHVTRFNRDAVDQLRQLRKRHAMLPIMVVVTEVTPQAANHCHALRASLLCDPYDPKLLVDFVQRAVFAHEANSPGVACAFDEAIHAWRLTVREAQVLHAAIQDPQHARIANALGISTKAVGFHARGILTKSGTRSLSHAATKMLRQVILIYALRRGSRPPARAVP